MIHQYFFRDIQLYPVDSHLNGDFWDIFGQLDNLMAVGDYQHAGRRPSGDPLCLQPPQDERHFPGSPAAQWFPHLLSAVLHFGLHGEYEDTDFTDQRCLA